MKMEAPRLRMSDRFYAVAFVIGVILFAASFAAGIYRTLLIHQRMPSISTVYWDELTQQVKSLNPPERVASLRIAAQIDYEQAKPFLQLWEAAIQSKDVDNQMYAMRGLVKLYHVEARPHSLLAAVLLIQGKFAESALHSRIALRLEPENASSHCNLGAALLGLGRNAEAVEHCQEALRLDPTMEPARRALQFATKGD